MEKWQQRQEHTQEFYVWLRCNLRGPQVISAPGVSWQVNPAMVSKNLSFIRNKYYSNNKKEDWLVLSAPNSSWYHRRTGVFQTHPLQWPGKQEETLPPSLRPAGAARPKQRAHPELSNLHPAAPQALLESQTTTASNSQTSFSTYKPWMNKWSWRTWWWHRPCCLSPGWAAPTWCIPGAS